MRVRDETLWHQQCAELRANSTGQDFLRFIQAWTDAAEQLHAEGIGGWTTALRHALEGVEDQYGQVGVHYLGQMLVVIATHWEHGEDMVSHLSSIELRLVQDVLALKIAELQRQAAVSEEES